MITDRLRPGLLPTMRKCMRRPAYDRHALKAGMAHIGVGAFHRCHQAEYTDDALEQEFGRWGVIGINVRPPILGESLAPQGGLYTRLLREGDRAEGRIIGSILAVVDSQDSPEPALATLASPLIDVVTMTITEKGYCHQPATGLADLAHPDLVHDLAHPDAPRSVPGLVLAAIERRMQSNGQPITFISCDNIPSNGAILGTVVRALAAGRGTGLMDWIEANVAFPETMVDRIVPATAPEDTAYVAGHFGYTDSAVVTGEPFRQWVIENRFAGRTPPWALAGATFVDDVMPFELIKMRVLNAAQTSMAYLGLLAGHEHTCDDMTDPLLTGFVRRMLEDETLPMLPPVPGTDPRAYLDQSFRRLENTAIRHRNHQIATDGSRKIVQRILNPIRDRLDAGASADRLTLIVAAWMTWLLSASPAFGARWTAEDPFAAEAANIAGRVGRDPEALVSAFLSHEAIFDPALAARPAFRAMLATHLAGLLSPDPIGYLRSVEAQDGG